VSPRRARVLAWSTVGAGVALAIAGGLVVTLGGAQAGGDIVPFIAMLAVFAATSVVGGLVASRRPQNPIGWIFCVFSAYTGLVVLANCYAEVAPDDARRGPGQAAAWFSNWSWVSLFTLAVIVLLLFPNGRLPSRRWRPAVWCGGVGTAAFAAGVAFDPGTLDEYPGVANPVGLDASLAVTLRDAGMILTLVALVAAVVSVVTRYRGSGGVARQQIKWLAAAGLVAVAGILAGTTMAVLGWDDVGNTVVVLGILGIPVAIGIAMLRYRLYDVDRVISRTLTYGLLTVALGAAYGGLVLAGQALFSSFAGGSDLAIAVSTLFVAALFLPVRARSQRFVDRRFYRRRYDAQRTLESFAARLREQVDLDTLAGELGAVVDEAMQPAHVGLWLRREGARP
jgi:hypothetical protein